MRTDILRYSRAWNVHKDRCSYPGRAISAEMMWSLMILHLAALIALLCSASATDLSVCPQGCICRTSGTLDEVTCHDLNLTSVPRGLPSSVVRLDLANNTLAVLDISQLHFLRRPAEVVLSGNQIQSIVDSREPERATSIQVQVLQLSHNRLTAIGTPAMNALSETLVQLDLSDNRLSSVEGVFVGCRLLSRLDLRHNLLMRVASTTFRDLIGLRYLRLEDNLISSVSVDAFVHLQHLSYLVLKGNPIGAATTTGDQLDLRFNTDLLSYLDLSEAELQRVPLGLPPSVRYLQLRKNRLKALSRKDFNGLNQLGILILDDNDIEEIEDGTFENLVHLSQLWMNGNRLMEVPPRLPPGVQRLLLDSNRIQKVTEQSFVGLSQVQTLSLMGNSISGIEVGTFDDLLQLTSLDLSGNQISRIVPGIFRRNTQLQVLHLSKNPLESLDNGAFEGLARLDQLSASYIPPSPSSFAVDALIDLQRLTRLDLDGSTDVIRALLTSGPLLRPLFLGLRDLSLVKSDLRALPPDFLSTMPQLISLRISSDRWHCDRSLLWLRDWLGNASVASDDNRCLSPRHVTGRLLSSLADDEFATHGTVTTAAVDGKLHLATDPFLIEGRVLFNTYRSHTTVTTATSTTGKDATSLGEVADLRTRIPKKRINDLSITRPSSQWPTTGLVPGIIPNEENDSIPSTPVNPWLKEAAVTTTPVSPAMAGNTSSLLSPYSGDDLWSGSVNFFHINKTGHVRNSAGNDASREQPNVTSDHVDNNDVVEPAKNELSIDAIVAIGTVAGTMVTAVVMVAVIVHLCRKEKAGVEPSTITSLGQGSSKVTSLGNGKEQEVVYCTPDLYADAESAHRNTLGRDRTLGSRDRTSGVREPDWPGLSTRMSTTSSKAFWDAAAASEATSLMGRNCGDGTQMRVYKWEEL